MYARILSGTALRDVVTVRLLADGDEATISALFARLSPASRSHRYHGSKPRLTESDLRLLARVDGDRHVLVAHVAGDDAPAAIARLVRDGRSAEIAFEVADAYQGAGIGTQLVELLLADARAAGIEHVEAWVEAGNRRAFALLRRVLGRPTLRCDGAEIRVAAPLARGA